MKDHRQEAGDNAQQYLAGGNIIIVQGVTEERAREIAEIASREVVLREGRAVAEAVITERTGHITDLVFDRINVRDTELFNRFEDPRFLAALTSAQRSYAETGDEDLAEVLASLVVELASQPIRSMHEIVLRQAIDVAPHLTSPHLRALAVNMYLTRFNFNQPYDTENAHTLTRHDIPPVLRRSAKQPTRLQLHELDRSRHVHGGLARLGQ